MEKTIFFDEAGFTGYNFLDPNQPIFIIASTDIKPDHAEVLLKKAFPKYQGKEFKFSNIWGSTNQKGFFDLAKSLQNVINPIYIYSINKRFAVLVKMVDFLLEPLANKAGYDFYANGYCWKLTNYIYYGFQIFEKMDLLDKMIVSYQTFSRSPSMEALKLMENQLSNWAKEVKEDELSIFIKKMVLGASTFPDSFNIENFKSSNELQLATMLAIVSWWRQNFSEDFIINHDASSNFGRQKDLWQQLTRNDIPPYTHPLGDGTFVDFPLRVIKTDAIDSKDNFSIQLCDLIAGFCSKHFDENCSGPNREFTNTCIDLGFSKIIVNSIKATPVFPDEEISKLNGPDAVDSLSNLIMRP